MKTQKIKIEIKTWMGKVLFTYSCKDNTLAKTVEKAIEKDANLRSANLRSADLSYANLRSADLSSADLRYANLHYADLHYANLSYAKNIIGDYTDFWWHIHHEVLVEQLNEPLRARINYIKEFKPKNEVKLRLKLLHPVLGDIPNTEKGWKTLHKKECKKCPWNGKTIFPKKGKA